MPDTHDFAFGGFGGDIEAVREGLALDDERVVADGVERAGDIGKELLLVVEDGRCFAVHHAIVHHDTGAEGMADALVSQADAQQGDSSAEGADDIVGEAGFAWRARAGGDQDLVGMELFDLGESDLVIAADLEGHLHFAQVLDEIIGEGIVVIDDKHHGVATGSSPVGADGEV